jgi:cytidylate kinase
MAVITISRQYGSGGDEVAALVSEKLGYPQFDKSQIEKAAAEAGLSQKEILDFSEENHKIKTFLDRLFNQMAVSAHVRTWEYPELIQTPPDQTMDETTLLMLVQNAIHSAYDSGNIVIVGRGSQAILKDQKGVIHVRVVAPLENRIQRVKEHLKLSRQSFQADMEIRRDAQDLIVDRDAVSADYIKQFYSVNWDDPLLYTVVLNTGHLTIEQAGTSVVELVKELEQLC